MTVEQVADSADPRLLPYRDVRDGELLRSRGMFVAEGRLVVRRVLENTRYQVQSIVVNDAALVELMPMLERCAPVPVFVCDADQLKTIAGYDVHRGCLAMVARPAPTSLEDVLAITRRLVVLEGVSNADNVGGVFRNAAAFGAGGVVLSPTCCDPLYRKAIRTSMGAALTVPFARADRWPAALAQIRGAGFSIVALTPREPSVALDAFAAGQISEKIALVAGTEGAGLTRAVEEMAEHRVRIPIRAEVDSLNLAVAVGISLHVLMPSENRD